MITQQESITDDKDLMGVNLTGSGGAGRPDRPGTSPTPTLGVGIADIEQNQGGQNNYEEEEYIYTEPIEKEPELTNSQMQQQIYENDVKLAEIQGAYEQMIQNHNAQYNYDIWSKGMSEEQIRDIQQKFDYGKKSEGMKDYILNVQRENMNELRTSTDKIKNNSNYDPRSDEEKRIDELQRQKEEREDNANQRAAEDMKKAGLNTGLMWGGGGAAQSSGASSGGDNQRKKEKEERERRRKRQREIEEFERNKQMQQAQLMANMLSMVTMGGMQLGGHGLRANAQLQSANIKKGPTSHKGVELPDWLKKEINNI